ncbi:MAG: hypothetical protein Ct9H90mP16_13210 [Candidatus Poseidoniales archaeon]|nr:MAG: hypothetical protein Ct9H90mP16_13210 [Candidatus Poseidoniales archaeon]
MRWENIPFLDPSDVGSLILFMNYTSSVDGDVSMQATVGEDGYYEFNVTLDENENIGLLPASLNSQVGMSMVYILYRHRLTMLCRVLTT